MWIETYRGTMVNVKTIEAVWVGKKEVGDKYCDALIVRTTSGNTYFVDLFNSKNEAEEAKIKLCKQLLVLEVQNEL